MEKPDYVKNFQRPEGTSLKKIGNHWYLYDKPTSTIDPETGKRKTVAGVYLGKVGPDGLVPPGRRAARRGKGSGDAAPRPAAGQTVHNVDLLPWYRWTWDDVEDEKDKQYRTDFEYVLKNEPEWLEAGPCVLVWSRTGALRRALKKHFAGDWKQIFAFAYMRLVHGHDFVRQKENYRASLLPAMFPGLEGDFPFLKYTDELSEFGRMREEIAAFMREQMTGAANADKDERDAGLDSDSRLNSVRWLVCESRDLSIDFNDPDYDAEEMNRNPSYNYDYDPAEGKSRQLVFPRVLYAFDMKFPGCPKFYKARTLLPLGLHDLDEFLEESGLSAKDCVFFLDGASLAGVEPAALEEKGLRVVRFLAQGTHFDKDEFPTLTDNDEVFRASPLYWHKPQRIAAMREKFEDGWRMSSIFDIDWYRASVGGILDIEEFNLGPRRLEVEMELERRARGEGKWTDEQIKQEQDELASRCRREIAREPDIGIMEVQSNLLDWSRRDLYGVCLRFANVNFRMRHLAQNMKEYAWGVTNEYAEEGWFLVDHVTLLMQWAVLPRSLRPHFEALNLSVHGVFHELLRCLDIKTRTGRPDPEKSSEYEESMLSRVLDFSMRNVDMAAFLAECRAEL